MNADECYYSIALMLCQGIGAIGARKLVATIGSAEEVFRRRKELNEVMPDITPQMVNALDCPEALKRAEEEMKFVERGRITCLTFHDENYPSRLRECIDAPVVLFYKGSANLNALRIVSMVGTRKATDYGKTFCANFVRDLARLCPEVVVVSGLAYGVDIHAHRAALANGLPTVGVLAHGLDRIYPSTHRNTAAEMVKQGGLLTEFVSQTQPERYNFISRNRIVAGMADATVVVESGAKGGALITARLAQDYQRDCFAVPGRVDAPTSEGCNQLIRDNRAGLIQNAEDLVKAMNWSSPDAIAAMQGKHQPVQRSLFVELSDDEQRIASLLSRRGDMHINALAVETETPVGKLTALLFEMEMKGVVKTMAGGKYHLLA